MKVTFKKIYQLNNNQSPLLGEVNILSKYDFMSDYLTNYQIYDKNFSRKYGYRFLVNDSEDEDAVNDFRYDCMSEIIMNSKAFEELAKILMVDYNPIENYDRYEMIRSSDSGTDTNVSNQSERRTTKDYGSDNIVDEYGSKTKTNVNGAYNDSTIYGESNTTNVYGTETTTNDFGNSITTNEIGEKTISTEEKVSAFNSNNYSPDKQTTENDSGNITTNTVNSHTDIITKNEKTDTITEDSKTDVTQHGERTDTYTENAFTDRHTKAAKTDIEKLGATSDTITTNYGKINDVESHVHGNIGVTTSVKMMDEHNTFWTNYAFWDSLFNKVTKNILTYYEV